MKLGRREFTVFTLKQFMLIQMAPFTIQGHACAAESLSFSLSFVSAADAATTIKSGRISSEELTRDMLERVERYNPELNAIITLLAESALDSARQADSRQARGESLGPLHGVPVTVKDIFSVKGARTTLGSSDLLENVSSDDATAVARLRDAGAVILGLTNIPYMAADWITNNEVFGRTNNPWNLELTPGGSTGGGAAAVAAGLSYLSLGSDIAGSIRVPAHFCGLFGHKPSLGVVPGTGSFPIPNSPPGMDDFLGVYGNLARSAADLKLGLSVIGGPDGNRAKAYNWSLPSPRAKKLSDYRIGFVLDDALCPVVPEVKVLLKKVINALDSEGVRLHEGWPAGLDTEAQLECYGKILNVHLNSNLDLLDEAELREIIKQNPDHYTADKARLFLGPTRDYLSALRQRTAIRQIWEGYFEGVDAFLMPAAFVPAIPHDANTTGVIPTSAGDRPYDDLLFWVAAPTLTGCPATVAPVGLTADQLPVGIQIMGPYFEDATCIDIAGKLSEMLGGISRPPAYFK